MIKKMGLFLCLFSLVFLVSGFAVFAADLFQAGTYTGEGEGYGGNIKVEVEVSDKKITAIDVLEHRETPGISDAAFNKIIPQIIEHQTIAVDTVSGATLTSKGVLEAVTAALAKTNADMEQLSKPVEKVALTDTIEKTADVVIIGAGGAGMSAAVEAIKAGRSVLVIEKQSAVGGNTILAGSAMNAANPEQQAKQDMSESELDTIKGILALEPKNEEMKSWQDTLRQELDEYMAAGSTHLFDSPSLHKLQTYIGGDSAANPKLVSLFGDKALEAVEFLSSLGAQWNELIQAAVGATWKRSHTPTTDFGIRGASFVLPQTKFVEENGGTIMLESKAEELIMVNGTCVGVRGTNNSGQPFEARANRGVIIATGGFGANVDMRMKYNKHWANLDASIPTSNGPHATGDGIVMAEAVGGNLVGMEWIQLLPTYGPGVFTPYIENQLYVNKEGNRFIREDGRRDVLAGAILEQTDGQIFILSDAHTVKDGWTSTGLNVDERMVGNGYVIKADTLEELADKSGIPYQNLKKSIDQFNNAVKHGNDPFGRAVFDQEFGVGPFYAGLTSPMVHHTMGGIEITENAEVLDAYGNVIPGLFAAGEVTGGIHGTNRLGGNAITDIVTFGRIAGQSASK